MNEKAKTSISIKQPVYEAALKLAATEERDFSFIVERALIGELRTVGVEVGKADDIDAQILSAAAEVGKESALATIRRSARSKARAVA